MFSINLNLVQFLVFSTSLTLITSQIGMDLMKTDYDDEILKAIPCIREMIEKYVVLGNPVGGSITLVTISNKDSILQHKLLKILSNNPNFVWTLMIKDSNLKNNFDTLEKAKCYLTIIEKSEDISDIINQWKSLTTWNPMAQVLIFLQRPMDYIELELNRRNLMVLLLQNRVLNAYVISMWENDTKLELSSLYPYQNDNCADRANEISTMENCVYDPEIDLTAENDNVVSYEIIGQFELKIPNDLHRCPLVVSSQVWEPYSVMSIDDGQLYSGIDVNIVKMITEKLNMELFLVPQNGSIYDIYEEVERGIYDMAIGGIDEDSGIKDSLSSTIAYYQDELTWCVAKAGLSSGWTKVWRTFDTLTWLTVGGFLIFSAICFAIFRSVTKRKLTTAHSILDALSIVLNQPLVTIRYKTPIRFVLFGLISFGMILNLMYQSVLITSLTRPTSDEQIRTVHQIVDLKMRVFGGYKVAKQLDKNNSEQTYLRSHLEVCEEMDECLQMLSYDRKLAVATSKEHVKYNSRIQHETIFCFPRAENIYSYLVSIVTVKNFHLLDKFNQIIRLITEAGLITKWKSELENTNTIRREMKKVRDDGPKALTFNELYGIFFVGAILLSITFLVFLFELLVFKLARRKHSYRFWKYLDRLLTADM